MQVLVGGVGIAPEQIAADGALEEHGLLRNDRDALAQGFLADIAHVHAAQQHAAFGRVVEAGDESDERGFAAARAADDADGLAGEDGEGDVVQRFRTRALVEQGDVFKLNAAKERVLRRDERAVLLGGADAQHGGDAVAAGPGLGQQDDQVGHLDQLYEDLAHVVVQRDDLALRQVAHAHAQRAGVDQQDDGGVDNHIRQRIHRGGDAAHGKLHSGEHRGALAELFGFGVFLAEGAQHAHAVQVFARGGGDAVQLALHAAIHRDRRQHDREDDNAEHGDHAGEDQRAVKVDGEGHDHRAEDDEWRAHQQAQAHVDAGLNLIHVAGHAGDQRGCAQRVDLRIGERLDMRHQHMAQAGGEADGGLGGKILRRDRADQAHEAQRRHDQHHLYDVCLIPAENAAVDDGGDHQRNEQLKGCFEHFKQRREHAFAAVAFEIDEEFFQIYTPAFLI